MKITSYLPLMLVPLVAACAAPPPDKCVPAAQITITPSKAAVTAVPENVHVKKGCTITVHVAGNPNKGSVSTTPKVATNTWLSGSNGSNAAKFNLFVNDEVKSGEYKYNVNTQGGAALDPRVTVDP